MNREQMEAWLSLEGYEAVQFYHEGAVANHAARHANRAALSLEGTEEMELIDMDIQVGGLNWFTSEDKPATWSIFSDAQVARIFELASTWDGEYHEP